MAISIETETQSTYNGSAVSSFTVNMPSSRPDGRLFIALTCCGTGASSLNAAAGWTQINVLSNGHFHDLSWRVGSSEPSTYTWTVTGGTVGTFSAVVYGIDGYDPNGGGASNPIHKVGAGNTGSDSTTEFDSLTTTIATAMLIGSASASGGRAITGVPTNYTQDDTSLLDRSLDVFHRLVTSTGSYTGTATWDATNNWTSWHVAIAQAPAVPSMVPGDRIRRANYMGLLLN